MRIRRILAIGATTLMLAAFSTAFAAACGDDDDDGGNKSGSDGGSISGGSVATGGDEAYVADICKAAVKFESDLQGLESRLRNVRNPDDIAKAISGPFDTFVSSLEKAKPPKDAVDSHRAFLTRLKDTRDKIKAGDAGAIANADFNDLPEPDQKVQDRLQKAADKNEDCKKSGFLID